MFAVVEGQAVDDLLVLAGAEGGDHERLGLAAGKERAAVGSGQQSHLGGDGAHRARVAPVDAPAGLEDVAADDALLQLLEDFGQGVLEKFFADGPVVRQLRGHPFLHRRHLFLAGQLDGLGVGLAQIRLGLLGHAPGEVLAPLGRFGQFAGLLGAGFGKVDDGFDHRLKPAVAEHHRAQHHLFGQLAGFRFHHQHAVAGAGDHQVQRTAGQFVDRGVEHVFAVDVADAAAGDGTHEGKARKGQRRRRPDQGDDVGVVLHVMGKDGADDLGFVPETLGE